MLRRRSLTTLIVAASQTVGCGGWNMCGSAAVTDGAAGASTSPTEARPYPAGADPVRYVDADAPQSGGDRLITVGLMPTANAPAVVQRITASAGRAKRIEFVDRDGVTVAIETDAAGLPSSIALASGPTILLDWRPWSSGTLLVRGGATRAQAESRAPVPLTPTPQQRAEIDRVVQQIRTTLTASGAPLPVPGSHAIAFATAPEGMVDVPLRTLVSRSVTVYDEDGKNVSANAQITEVSCTHPISCQWRPDAHPTHFDVHLALTASILLPRDERWGEYKDACEAASVATERTMQNATANAALLGLLMAGAYIANPVAAAAFFGVSGEVAALFASLTAAAPEVARSVLWKDCAHQAYQQYAEYLAASTSSNQSQQTTIRICVATNDEPPLRQCESQVVKVEWAKSLDTDAWTWVFRLRGRSACPKSVSTVVFACSTPVPTATAAPTRTATAAATPAPPSVTPTLAAAIPTATRPPAPTATVAATRTPTPAPTPAVLRNFTITVSSTPGTNQQPGTTTIGWSGNPLFPVSIRNTIVSCPIDCFLTSATFAQSANPLIMQATPGCAVEQRRELVYDFYMQDATGARSPVVRHTLVCTVRQ